MFRSEDQLVNTFVALLKSKASPWAIGKVVQEFPYVSGRTDVVLALEHKTVAFEAKLKDWKRGLEQAYRDTCCADESYLLLPAGNVGGAAKCLAEFSERGVGLCCVSDDAIQILLEPNHRSPLEPWITQSVRGLAFA